ncbi:hypothetical protein H072_13 [Dactylellina haptotyla CBS 200.50]|uniref:Major facilitator superfamily (MFS) profile domain-containing protein n=1 Tax=Dactylellina haptotyla (strain CBS 200.50) TaxID=1284197 RepID=S8ASI3_DACHA|nr:hypothetical protein H072_13 [Dactylellina haptotyla CBS 200.50]
MSTNSERKYLSDLVPRNVTVLNAVLIMVAIVNSATLGYDASVMNGLSILSSYTEYFHLNNVTTGLNNAAVWMGCILGFFVNQYVPDKSGRKNAILIATIITAIGIVLQAAAQNIGMFVLARIIIGFGTILSNVAAPSLLAELLPPHSRAWILGIFFSCFYVGGLLSAIINYGSQNIMSTWSWRVPSLLQIIPSLVSIIFLPFIPESPRWLIANSQEEHALEILAILKSADKKNSVTIDSLREIKTIIAREEIELPRNPFRELISTSVNRKRLNILIGFGIMTETLGNFIISYYLTRILSQAGITDPNRQNQINVILQCWGFVAALLGSFMLDILGRRIQTLIGVFGMATTLYIIGALIKVYGDSTDPSKNYGIIAVIFFFQGFSAFSITPMTSLYPAEICQYRLRAAGVAIFRLADNIFGLVASFALSFAMSDLGWKFYLMNATWDIFMGIYTYIYFVETKGLPLEDIATKFGDIVNINTLDSLPEEIEVLEKTKGQSA